MPSGPNPLPQITAIPTVLWELQRGGMRLTCSARQTEEGLRLEESINEGDPFVQLTVRTTEELQALAEKFRQQDIEDGWTDTGS